MLIQWLVISFMAGMGYWFMGRLAHISRLFSGIAITKTELVHTKEMIESAKYIIESMSLVIKKCSSAIDCKNFEIERLTAELNIKQSVIDSLSMEVKTDISVDDPETKKSFN